MWYIRWLTLYHWYQKWALEEWQTTSYSLYMLAFCFLPACGCYSSRRSCPGHSYWSDYLLESFYSYLQINRMYSKGVKATTAISTACTCLTTVYNCVHSNQLPPGLGADVMLQADIFSVYTVEINVVKITEWWKVSIFDEITGQGEHLYCEDDNTSRPLNLSWALCDNIFGYEHLLPL